MIDSRTVLERSRVIAVVGMSTDPTKAAHRVPVALRDAGWTIHPVHPSADEIAGLTVHRSLADVPEPIDVVEVFRPAAEAPGIAEEAVAVGARTFWLQLRLTSPEARRIAEEGGLDYVEDRCLGAERARLGITRD
jgi:uncharacterized protein